VLGVPNIEMYEPYETQAYGVMVLEVPTAMEAGQECAKRLGRRLPRGDQAIVVDAVSARRRSRIPRL